MALIRLAREEDFPAMQKIYAPYVEETTVSFEYAAPSVAEFSARMRGIARKHPVLVCEEAGEIVGYAYTADAFERAAYAWCAELSVYLGRDRRGKGYGRRLVTAAEEILRLLGYRKLYSLITEENAASVRFHLSMGYHEVARFPEQGYKAGRWLAVVWLEKELRGREVCARMPLFFPKADDKAVRDILSRASEER